MAKIKTDMEKLPRGSKQWLGLAKQLLRKKCSSPLFPPLKGTDGAWLLDPVSKANAFATCWKAKNQIPDEVFEMPFFPSVPQMTDLNVIRTRSTFKELNKLRLDQATGPDRIAAVFLRRLSKELALPVAVIARRVFREGWPAAWRVHCLVPLFKKGSVFDPNKYRGVHLSCVLSKVIERVIGNPLVSFLQAKGYGDAQWAFRKKSSARDLITASVARWVLRICQGHKVGIYIADISGAFDKVSRTLLLAKLEQLGVAPAFLDFLNSYLLSRQGFVTVEGALSECMLLTDMVYQGTVLGPPLWNAFFSDISIHVPEDGQHIQLFADDLKVDASCPVEVSSDTLRSSLAEAQERAHTWGAHNRVCFDPSKEAIRIIHPLHGDDEEFVLLGTLFDCHLSMDPCLDGLLKTLRPKVRALVKTKAVHSVPAMLNLYKAHIWSKMEYHNGALIIAGEIKLRKLDKMQRGFLYELGLDDKVAFVEHNFAPPSLRRAIGLLGFLHKRVLGLCHPALKEVFPFGTGRTRASHTMPLETFFDEVRGHSRLYNSSIYMYVLMYNRLPQVLVDCESVATFQSKLTQLATMRAQQDDGISWRAAFQSCSDIVNFF